MISNDNSVTVIIPAYSRVDLLIKTLESVFKQKGNFKLKVVVVDDHSPERLQPIIWKKFPQVAVIRNEKNLLNGLAKNRAFPLIRSRYVAFLDSDDIWNNTFIIDSINMMESVGTKASVCLSNGLFENSLTSWFRTKIAMLTFIKTCLQLLFFFVNNKVLPKGAFYLCQMSHLMFEAESIKKVRFDPKYDGGGNDWNFVIKVMDYTDIAIVPKKLTNYRYHARSWIKTKQKFDKKWISYMQLFDELKKREINDLWVLLFRLYIFTFRGGIL